MKTSENDHPSSAEEWKITAVPFDALELNKAGILVPGPKGTDSFPPIRPLAVLQSMSMGKVDLGDIAEDVSKIEPVTTGDVRNDIETILLYYQALTVTEAVAVAIKAGHLNIEFAPKPVRRLYSRNARILRHLMAGVSKQQISRLRKIPTREDIDRSCESLMDILEVPSMPAAVRRATEYRLKPAPSLRHIRPRMVMALPERPSSLEPLSELELAALVERSYGYTNEEAADRLGIRLSKVKTLMGEVAHKLCAVDAVEAATKAFILDYMQFEEGDNTIRIAPRALTALALSFCGLTSEEIGGQTSTTRNTARTYLRETHHRLGSRNQYHSPRLAFGAGLIVVGKLATRQDEGPEV